MKKIRVGIIGVGNCASSLIQGTQYYIDNPEDKVGLMYEDIGGYTANDIQYVVGFDVDRRKVGLQLDEAIHSKPNCAMRHVDEISTDVVPHNSNVYSAPLLDGVAPHMYDFPEEVSFRTAGAPPAISFAEAVQILKDRSVDMLVNYLPVGSEEASIFWVSVALDAGVHFVNCIPTLISTEATKMVEQKFIDKGLTFVGSDMRSGFGASRLSEVLQGSMLDSGLMVTYHTQTNRIGGATQGMENVRSGVSSNTDFANMATKDRLKNKHISKENVLKGQNSVRNKSIAGTTLYAGPSLTVQQKPGGTYIGSDNKIADIDIKAFGFGGAIYTLQARLSCQDSPNSSSVVLSAIRFSRVASEMGIVGYLRGASCWINKTPPTQMKTEDAKFECDALARRELTSSTRKQLKKNNPKVEDLEYTEQSSENDYS